MDTLQIVDLEENDLDRARIERQLHADGLSTRIDAAIFDQAGASIILSDRNGIVLYWNDGAEILYGRSKAEVLGRSVYTILGIAKPLQEEIDAALASTRSWNGEFRIARRERGEITVASRWSASSSGAAVRLHLDQEISEQTGDIETLRENEAHLRYFADEDITGKVIISPDGNIRICNSAFARMLGFESITEAQQANFTSLLRSRKDAAELIDLVRQRGAVDRHELEMRELNGDSVSVVTRFVGAFDHAHKLTELRGYLFNDTKRKRLAEQLVQAQKMEGLGTLAGGIAHDFNNILTIILGYAAQLEAGVTNRDQIPRAVRVIKDAVDRGAALVQQLLTSARQTEARLASVDLNEVVLELERMLRATFPKMINFDLRLQSNLPMITADRNQIHQVLLNLCVNARDAMPAGGVITLETSSISGSELGEDFAGADAEKYAGVRISDTGSGMTREIKSHIFEPFFTTKERGKGTGLGLSVVYGVVNSHRGFVQAASEPGKGTTFSIYLPMQQAIDETSELTTATIAKNATAQTILLVEDEEMLRELGTTMLEAEGYQVLTAKDGVEAVEIFCERRDEIGLVVCDLGLPRLGGRDVFMKMKENKPDVRAIVVSGYLEPNMRSEILKAGVIDTIQKPYDFRDLLEKIRAVIGAPEPVDDEQPQLF
ncbi:MAG: ATP-binding protein [Chthoniobacterales bacterium]